MTQSVKVSGSWKTVDKSYVRVPSPQYVCPSGYTDVGGICRATSPYTYTTLPYTYSTATVTSPYTYTRVVVDPGGVADSFYTDWPSCPAGYNLEDYNWTFACTLYYAPTYRDDKNPPPDGWIDNGTEYETTVTVKDTPPAGFTDDGTQWVAKDAPPSGWIDDGTQYVSIVNKIPDSGKPELPVWKEVSTTFVKVNGVWESLSVPVPDLAGLSPEQADAAITAAQLTKGTTSSGFTSNQSLDNKVGAQTIAAGTLVVPGTALGYTFTTYKATPEQPTLSYYGTTGKFQITNYNSSYIYTISSGTRSGSIVTLPGANTSATIKAQSFSGGDFSPTTTYEQKSARYTEDTRYSYPCGTACDTCQNCGCECAGGGCGCYPNASQSWGQCGCPGTMCWYGSYECNCRTTYCSGGSAPSLINEPGYTWTGLEWYKITY